MVNLLLVFVGGGAGAACRYLAGAGYLRLFGPHQPWLATFSINVLGGLLMGLLVGWLALAGGAGHDRLRVFLAVGVLGGFTTFSSFSLEVVLLIQRKAFALATGYVAGSVVMSVLAVMLGMFAMRKALA